MFNVDVTDAISWYRRLWWNTDGSATFHPIGDRVNTNGSGIIHTSGDRLNTDGSATIHPIVDHVNMDSSTTFKIIRLQQDEN